MDRRASDGTERHWHLDKRVPVALIVAIMVQTGTAVWWAAGQDATVANHSERLAKLEAQEDKVSDRMRSIEERLVRLEANGDAQLITLERIYNILDKQRP